MSQPFDKKTVDFDTKIAPLIGVIGKITDCEVVPNAQVAQVKQLPFVTYYPLVFDDPVFGDATANDGSFEATISLDVFSNELGQGMQVCGDLRAYLLDPYVRQLLRTNARITIQEATSVKTRSVTDLPFHAVHHHGFELTIQYWRHYTSPIDVINAVEGFFDTKKEDE